MLLSLWNYLFDTFKNVQALHNAMTETQDRAKETAADVQQSINAGSVGKATEQSSQHEIGHGINKSAMDAIKRDVDAMHHTDPEGFERVGTKIEETFGASALTDDGPDPTQYNLKRFHR